MRRLQSFFLTSTIGDAYGLQLSLITRDSYSWLMWALTTLYSDGGMWRCRCRTGTSSNTPHCGTTLPQSSTYNSIYPIYWMESPFAALSCNHEHDLNRSWPHGLKFWTKQLSVMVDTTEPVSIKQGTNMPPIKTLKQQLNLYHKSYHQVHKSHHTHADTQWNQQQYTALSDRGPSSAWENWLAACLGPQLL